MLDPEVELFYGGWFVDVVDLALPFFEGFLNDLLLLEVVDLLLDFPALRPNQRLAEHEEEGGRNGLRFALAVCHFCPVDELRHDEAQGVVSVSVGHVGQGEDAQVDGVQLHADAGGVDEAERLVHDLRFLFELVQPFRDHLDRLLLLRVSFSQQIDVLLDLLRLAV